MDLMARRLALHTARALLDNLPRAEIGTTSGSGYGSGADSSPPAVNSRWGALPGAIGDHPEPSVLLKRFGSFDRAEHAARDLYETEA